MQEFLFESKHSRGQDYRSEAEGSDLLFEDRITALQNQVNSLQARVTHLETTLENPEHALRSQNKAPEAMKTFQQGNYNYTLKENKSPYLVENDERVD